MKCKSVIKNGSLYIFGNLFNKAVAFITVPIFTRMLTTEEYGTVNTYSAWVNMMAVIVGLSLGNSIRNAFVDMREELGRYISSIFTLACVNFGIICTIFIFIGNHISLPRELIWFCLVESFFNFIINATVMRYVMEEEAVKRTSLLVLPNLVGAVLSVLLIYILHDNKHYGRIIATCGATTVFGFSIMLYYMIRYRTFFNKKFWGYALPISIPLIFHGISCNVLGTSDRSIITYYCGAAETGIYSLIYNLSMVSSVLTSSAESVWIPRMTVALQEKNYKTFNREVCIYIYVVLFAFCGLLTFAPELVLVLGGREYLSGCNMIFPIMASSFVMFIYSIYVNIEYYYKKTKMIAVATIVAAGLNLILNFIFVPKFGSTAAAYTTLVSYFVSFILHSLHAKKVDKAAAPYKILMLPVVIIIIAGFITNFTFNMIAVRWAVMCSFGIVYAIVIWKTYIKDFER